MGRHSRAEGPVSQDGASSQAAESQRAVAKSPSQASRKMWARKPSQAPSLMQSPVKLASYSGLAARWSCLAVGLEWSYSAGRLGFALGRRATYGQGA